MPSVQQIMARSASRVGVRGSPDHVGGHAGEALALRERERLDVRRVLGVAAVARSTKRWFTRPAWMISRAIVWASAMSVPTSRPSQPSAHLAEDVRAGPAV